MDEKAYQKLLKKGIKELPEALSKKERFEIPKVIGHIQGNNSIITNYNQIAKELGRDPDHLLKFILKETASPGKYDGQRLILGRKISASLLNQKIKQYADAFVLCAECGKPDTNIISEKNILVLKCTACGSKRSIKSL